MSKIVKNNTASPVFLADIGATIPASGQYVIAATDYLHWAASSDIVIKVGDGTLTINDGSEDLSISDGIDLIKGLFPKLLAVRDDDVISILNAISLGQIPVPDIFKRNEAPVISRVKADLPNTTYTVTAGKSFGITSFVASYDFSAGMYVRVEKQTAGAGPWEVLFRMNMSQGGQSLGTISFNFGAGILVAQGGDKLKITYESSIAKGTLWAEYAGREY